jgi:hypothetical protein
MASVTITVRQGSKVLFWVDPWIAGIPVSVVAPAVLKMVRPGLQTRLLQDGLPNNAWV